MAHAMGKEKEPPPSSLYSINKYVDFCQSCPLSYILYAGFLPGFPVCCPIFARKFPTIGLDGGRVHFVFYIWLLFTTDVQNFPGSLSGAPGFSVFIGKKIPRFFLPGNSYWILCLWTIPGSEVVSIFSRRKNRNFTLGS